MDLKDIIEEVPDDNVSNLMDAACRCHALMNLPDDSHVEYPFSLRRGGKERKVILVVNDRGQAEYKMLHPDGHLGSVED